MFRRNSDSWIQIPAQSEFWIWIPEQFDPFELTPKSIFGVQNYILEFLESPERQSSGLIFPEHRKTYRLISKTGPTDEVCECLKDLENLL